MNMTKDRLHGRKTLKVTEFLDEFEKDDVKKTVDIVGLFSSFGVTLSKKGKSFVGRCPWHEDASPSLSVDREKGLYNCFGCGEAGDVFTLVEKMKGVGFKEALEYLRKVESRTSKVESDDAATPKTTVSRAAHRGDDARELHAARDAAPLSPETSGITLTSVADYYHKKLFQHEEALAYLKSRGLVNLELYVRFRIGVADGSLMEKIGEGQRKELRSLGMVTEKGREHFKNCVTFPVLDDLSRVVGMYGRRVENRKSKVESGKSKVESGAKHLYLPGPHCGVWNRKASKVYDEIILTESIIDALSLMEMGLENVQALYGTGGFTEEHLQVLKDDRVKTVVLALDADEPGRAASERLKEKLLGEGFAVKVLSPADLTPALRAPLPGGEGLSESEFSSGELPLLPSGEGGRGDEVKDWNEYLIAGGTAGAVKAAIAEAETCRPRETAALSIRKESQDVLMTTEETAYRVSGVKEMFINNLRVNIRAERRNAQDTEGPARYYDNVDLYSARSRAGYAANLAREFCLEAKRVEKDLIALLEYCEGERDRALLSGAAAEEYVMTEEERRAGMELLQSPRLLEEIVEDMDVLGYVGERYNKELLYLAATSRKLDDPVSVLIVSQSASGKSMLVDTVRALMPPEEVIAVTSLSDQALNYVADMAHKFLILSEAIHNETVEHQLREMLSAKELSRLVTMKDPKTGEMKTRMVRTRAVVSTVMSSTRYDVNPENASRSFMIVADESREQTRRIFQSQRRKYSLERYREKKEIVPGIVARHHAAQRLLANRVIFNPFARYLNFPDSLMRTRRDHDRFMDLIACVCFLRQYQKQEGEDGGVRYIECDLDDYRIAYPIMVEGVLSSTMRELPEGAVMLYEELRSMLRAMAAEEKLLPVEIGFIQKDVRERTGMGGEFVKKHLRTLVEYEYVQVAQGRSRGTRFMYRLREDASVERVDLSMIPSPETMARLIRKDGGAE